MKRISEKIGVVKDKIQQVCGRAGRDPSEVKLIVVTKSADFEEIKQVLDCGCTELGENRVQQLKKIVTDVQEYLNNPDRDQSLSKTANWHMIGHLQRNKARSVLEMTTLIHSVDTLRLAEEISMIAEKLNITPKILLQVNSSQEPQKYGVPVAAATYLAEQIETLPNIKLVGLMTMAPLTKDESLIRECFSRTRELFIEIKGEKIVGEHFTELSMGMSNDYEIAIEEGSTLLRIGSAIFA